MGCATSAACAGRSARSCSEPAPTASAARRPCPRADDGQAGGRDRGCARHSATPAGPRRARLGGARPAPRRPPHACGSGASGRYGDPGGLATARPHARLAARASGRRAARRSGTRLEASTRRAGADRHVQVRLPGRRLHLVPPQRGRADSALPNPQGPSGRGGNPVGHVGAKFLDTIGGKLAENWAASVLTPALLFWVGGLLALTWRTGWEPLERWLAAQSALSQLFLAGGALAVFAASAVVVDALNISVLRLLEGYWPRWLGRLRRWSGRRLERRIGEREARLQVLAARRATLTAEETAELAALQQELHGVPALPVHYMPTRFGNMLRAAERRI